MSVAVNLDPYALMCSNISSSYDDYLQFIKTLLDWQSLISHKDIELYIHSDVAKTLINENAYPMHDILKSYNNEFNIDFISPDAVNKIVGAFLNKSRHINSFFDLENATTVSSHRKLGVSEELDFILEQIYCHISLVNSKSYLLSQNFDHDKIKFECLVNDGICNKDMKFPHNCSSEIEVLKEFDVIVSTKIETELIETDIKPKDKIINLSGDHHGNKELLKVAKKLVKSPYVSEIINNIEYQPHESNFIHKIYPDGKIEVVLTETDKGFGMVLQTTGQNLEETTRISKAISQYY